MQTPQRGPIPTGPQQGAPQPSPQAQSGPPPQPYPQRGILRLFKHLYN